MWKYLIALLPFAASGYAAVQTGTHPDGTDNSPQFSPSILGPESQTAQSYMLIPPSARALDFLQAFELLRKEKSTGKVYFQLTNGSTISNVIEMSLMPNSTLILFRFNSSQGIRFQVVKVEDIQNIGYL